jgi:hypothetical protein
MASFIQHHNKGIALRLGQNRRPNPRIGRTVLYTNFRDRTLALNIERPVGPCQATANHRQQQITGIENSVALLMVSFPIANGNSVDKEGRLKQQGSCPCMVSYASNALAVFG